MKKYLTEKTTIVAENIRQTASEKGLLLKGIAKRSGLTDRQLCNILHGRKLMTVDHILNIAQALDVSVGELLDGKTAKGIILNGIRYSELVVTKDDEVIASISAEDVIEKDGYKVVCVPLA